MRCYMDEDVPLDVAIHFRLRRHDAVAAAELGHKGLSDPRQPAFALLEDRVLVTCNRRDFLLLHETLVIWSREHPSLERPIHAGILILPNGREIGYRGMVEMLEGFAQHREAERLAGRLFRWRAATAWEEVAFPP